MTSNPDPTPPRPLPDINGPLPLAPGLGEVMAAARVPRKSVQLEAAVRRRLASGEAKTQFLGCSMRNIPMTDWSASC